MVPARWVVLSASLLTSPSMPRPDSKAVAYMKTIHDSHDNNSLDFSMVSDDIIYQAVG
jgi:hypothetical protein